MYKTNSMSFLMRISLLWVFALVVYLASCSPDSDPSKGLENSAGNTSAAAILTDISDFAPTLDPSNEPFTMAIVSSGDFYFYSWVFRSIYDGLAWHGWTRTVTWEFEALDQLSSAVQSIQNVGGRSYVNFPQSLYLDLEFSADHSLSKDKIRALAKKSEIDGILVLGTDAGIMVSELLRQGEISVPVFVESASDPISSGIIHSVEDSGHDLLSVSIDPGFFARQVEVFHRAAGFERLGVLYVDTLEGRSYIGLDQIQLVAKNRNFEVVSYTDIIENPTTEEELVQARSMYLEGVRKLANKVDALVLGLNAGFDEAIVPEVVQITRQKRIATYSTESKDFARNGIFMSYYEGNVNSEGRYTAEKIIQVLKGAQPRTLNQINQHASAFLINLAVAREIGVTVPMDIMLSVERVYDRIEKM